MTSDGKVINTEVVRIVKMVNFAKLWLLHSLSEAKGVMYVELTVMETLPGKACRREQ